MVSPFLESTTSTTNYNASVRRRASGNRRSEACTCRCHLCHHHFPMLSTFSVTVPSPSIQEDEQDSRASLNCEAEASKEDHKEFNCLLDRSEDDMTSSHSNNIAPLQQKESCCSRRSSSCWHCITHSEQSCCTARISKEIADINCTECSTSCQSSPCDSTYQTLVIPDSSTNSCTCNTSRETAQSQTNSESRYEEDKYLVQTMKMHCCCSCSMNNKVAVGESCFTDRHVVKTEVGDDNSDTDIEKRPCKCTTKMEESRAKESQRVEGSQTTRLFRVDPRLWMFCASLLFLSLAGSTTSYSVFDDGDDDYGGSLAQYAVYPRYRRSAEHFSSLHDALSLIPSNYSIHEPPPTNNSEATQVDFSVLIMNVRDIKELNEGYGDLELSLEMNLRIYWKDTRLSHLADRSGNKFIVLNPVLLDKLWHPDIFIDHVKAVAQPALISKPASLRVYPDSSVRYSARITVTMACQMDFHYYPADTQRCNVDMKSYAYSSKILALDWREGKGALLVEYLELPNFDVALDTTQNFMVNTSSGSYSGIRFTILLRRKLSYHLIQTYLPSTLFIIVSWLSFLVPPESVPGRMALCMTTLLTLTAMFSAVRQNTPNVSYVKALDIWMVVCIIFVFLTLVEYTVLLKLKSKKSKPRPPPSAHPTERVTSPVQQQQPPPVTRWTIPTLQYASDNSKLQFRGCKSADGVVSENGNNGANGEMRHRENGDSTLVAGGDGGNAMNLSVPPAPPPSAHPPSAHPPPPPPPPLGPGDRPLNKYELAAKKIEKFTSAVIPTLFVIFQFIYWPWLINSSEYYHQDKTTTFYKAI